MASGCAKIAWGRSGSKFWQKSCIFMLDFDAKGSISIDFPMGSIILPNPLGVHLRLEIGAPGLPNRSNFARGIRFRGLKLPKRRGHDIFFIFPPAAGFIPTRPSFHLFLRPESGSKAPPYWTHWNYRPQEPHFAKKM